MRRYALFGYSFSTMSDHEDDCVQATSHFEHLDEVNLLLQDILQDTDSANASLKRLNEIVSLAVLRMKERQTRSIFFLSSLTSTNNNRNY